MPPNGSHRLLTPRTRAIVYRWIDMACCGMVAAATVLLVLAVLGPPLVAWLGSLIGRWTPTHAGMLLLAVAVVFEAVLWRFGAGRWRAMLGVRHGLACPGVAASAVIGLLTAALALWLISGNPIAGELLHTWEFLRWLWDTLPWAVVGVALVLGGPVVADIFWRRLATRDNRPRDNEGEPLPECQDDWAFEHWRQWSSSDREIYFKDDDHFDAHPIAERIARRLRPGNDDEQPSIALVGPKGSGKSSILEMVCEELRGEQDIEIIRVSLWPFDSPEAAMRGVLGQLIDRIGEHAPTLGLTGFPGKYLAAVDHMAGRWGVLRFVGTTESDPVNLLNQIERIAEAIDVQFVLAIEDFERFREGHADASSLGPIRALLYQLDQRERVSVVMASGDLDDRFDMEKIARYVERVPKIAVARTAMMLDRFRTACMKFEPDGLPILDPWRHQRDEEMFQRIVVSDDMVQSIGQFRPPSVARAVARLASTPRSLKSAVRGACEAWAELPGEIDIDDMVVLSVFKEAEPNAYAFVTSSEHIGAFRQTFRMDIPSGRRNQSDHPSHRKFMVLLDSLADKDRRQAVWSVVAYLFPGVDPVMGDTAREARASDPTIPTHHQVSGWIYNEPKGPQTIARESPVDYLGRFEALAMVANQLRDQDALRALDQWAASDTQPLLAMLFDPNTWPIVERFGQRLTPEQQLTLLRHVIDRTLLVGWNATEVAYAPGLSPLQEMFRLQPPDREALASVLCQTMPKIVTGNIHLAMMVEYLFAKPASEIHTELIGNAKVIRRELIGDAERHHVREAATQAFKSAFEPDKFTEFDAAMAHASPYSLKFFCWTLWRIQNDDAQAGLPWDGWEDTSRFLLRYGQHSPDRARIIIAPFIARAENGDWQWTGEFKLDLAQRLFDIDRLAALYQGAQVPEELEEQPRLCVQAAIDWANAQPVPDKPNSTPPS